MRKNTCVVKEEGLGPVLNNKKDPSLDITSFLQQFDSEHITGTMFFSIILKMAAEIGHEIETALGSEKKNTHS